MPRSARGTAFPERSPPGLGLAGAGAGACSRLVLAAWSRLQCLFRAWEPELQLRDAPASTFPEPPPRRGGFGGHSGRPGSSWDPGHSTLGVLHPTSGLPLLVRPQSRPSWGPEATQVHPGRGHSLWEWAGGEPSWTPPGLSSWARTEGRVGAHSFHRLARGWAGMPRPTRGLLGTPPPSPGCGHGLAGLPRPGPDLEERARGPRWQAARTAEEPLCLPPAHSGQRLHWTQSSWQMTQDLWGRPPPLLPLPGGCGPCVSRAGGFQHLGSWL